MGRAIAILLLVACSAAAAGEAEWMAALRTGQAMLDRGDFTGAIRTFEEASRDGALTAAQRADAIDRLGLAYQEQRKLDAAHAALRRALAMRQEALGPSDPSVATSMQHLGTFLNEHRLDPIGAEPFANAALAIRETALGPDHLLVAESLMLLAAVDAVKGKAAEAEPLLKRAVAIREKSGSLADLSESLLALGNIYRSMKRPAEAVEPLKRAIAIDPSNATAYVALARVYQGMKRAADAAPLQRRAKELFAERDAAEAERAKLYGARDGR
jgi:tetratricopeptide (TPR) repeat protein